MKPPIPCPTCNENPTVHTNRANSCVPAFEVLCYDCYDGADQVNMLGYGETIDKAVDSWNDAVEYWSELYDPDYYLNAQERAHKGQGSEWRRRLIRELSRGED